MVEAVNPTSRPNATNLDKDSRTKDVRRSNIEAAGRVAMLLKTCLGPVGRDKM
ncbi:MAG: T-complex protein 1 subunit delta, partial [Paramarteilia canceri]